MTRFLIVLTLAQLAALNAGQEPRTGPQPLRSGCSADEEPLAMINADDAVEVHQALAGGEKTCFRVTLTRGGRTLTGYVLGDALPAVAAFVRQQEKYRDGSFEAQDKLARARREALARTPPPAAATSSHPAARLNPNMLANFEEFAGRDTKGKPVSLSGLGGRAILVTFWSPRSPASRRQLVALLPLYNQYKPVGLRAVGISMDPNPSHIAQALDDITIGWPQMPDRSGLATRYRVNPTTGTTLVLDASHRIVAAGLTPGELEKTVSELLAAR